MPRLAPVESRVLVASNDAADAEMVADLLRPDFIAVGVTFDPDRSVEDFESHNPQVLVLAFRDLAGAEQYYLGLYRLSDQIHTITHRTVVLCQRGAARRAYELCHMQHFDDYVVFWPTTDGPQRLRMSTLLAARAAAGALARGPNRLELARQAHRILELEDELQKQSAEGSQRLEAVNQSLSKAELDMHGAVDGISREILADRALAHGYGERLATELQRLSREGIGTSLRNVEASLGPMQQWLNTFKGEIAPRFESVHEVAESARGVKPLLLVVDDDHFQLQLVRRMLGDLPVSLVFASTGNEALAMLRSHRPDLVLMDVLLPDINGVEVIRRIRSVPALAKTPVVFMTGNSTKSVLAESLHVGANDFVAKPFNQARLTASIERLLGPPVKLSAS